MRMGEGENAVDICPTGLGGCMGYLYNKPIKSDWEHEREVCSTCERTRRINEMRADPSIPFDGMNWMPKEMYERIKENSDSSELHSGRKTSNEKGKRRNKKSRN